MEINNQISEYTQLNDTKELGPNDSIDPIDTINPIEITDEKNVNDHKASDINESTENISIDKTDETLESSKSTEILDDEETELEWLIKQKNELLKEEERIRLDEEQLEQELKQHTEDAKNNLSIFLHWIKNNNCLSEELYKNFCENFSEVYRSELFENICEFFRDETYVTDEILFYWKSIVVHLLKKSKKYRGSIGDLVFNPVEQHTNLKIVKEKYIFKCFIDCERICYFKENGIDYYIS